MCVERLVKDYSTLLYSPASHPSLCAGSGFVPDIGNLALKPAHVQTSLSRTNIPQLM